MDPYFGESEGGAPDRVEEKDAGLLDVEDVPVQDGAVCDLPTVDREERLVPPERHRQAQAAGQDD